MTATVLHLVRETQLPHTRLPVASFMNEEATIVIRTVHERVFTDPDLASDFKDFQERNNPEARVSFVRRSSSDLPVLSLLVLQHAYDNLRHKEFSKLDFEELYARWRYAQTSITPVLSRLAKEGHLVRVRQGWYMLSE